MAENKQQQQLKEITEKLEQGVKDLFTSDKYMEYLRVMSQFHNYSFSNTLLIAMQKPEATLVAGYGAWQTKFERNVMKGEKAIKIFAPAPRKVEVERDMLDPDTKRPVIDENGEVKKEKVTVQQPYFKVTSVFDVSQTDGKPLPELDTVHDLTDSVEGYNIFFEALKRTSKVPIDFQPIEGGSHGFYHQVEKRIAIAEGMSQAQNVKTGIHELAHSRLHDIDMADAENGNAVDRRTREVQAESIAYTVCQHYGIDTSDYSFGYIAGWSEGKDMKELRGSMEIIRREADSMIKEIDRHLADIRREREQESELTAEEEKSFIAKYYVVEDLQVRGALQIEKFDDLETALEAYFALTDDKVRALGIENSKPRTGSLDFIHCHDGKDEIVQDYQRVDGWMNPEIIAVVDRIQTVLEEREAISERDTISSLVSENTEPSQAFGGHSPQEIEKMVVETALAELSEKGLEKDIKLLGARVYGERTREGMYDDHTDINVVLSFEAPNGELYEDEFYKAINENNLKIEGISINANPISLQETGTLQDFMIRAETYLDRKALQTTVLDYLVNSYDEADLLASARIAFPEVKGETLYEIFKSASIDKLREKAEVMDGIEVFGHEGVFTNGRLNKKDLPEGLYAYDLRGSDDDPGQFVTIEPFVLVNHAGTVVLSEKLDFADNDRLELGEDWTFSGEAGTTLEDFYNRVAPGKGEGVYEKDAADLAEKAVAFYGSETKLFDYLGDEREKMLTDLIDKFNISYIAYMEKKELEAAKPLEQDKRFSVVVMEDGADHAYEVWDSTKNNCYVDENGKRAEFMTRWQAEDFASEHNRWVAEHGGIGAELLSEEIVRENAEIDAIYDFLSACKIDDISVTFENGEFSATDGETTWKRQGFYEFLLNDVVTIDENGKLVEGFSMRDEVLEPIVQYANEAGATIEKQSVAKEEPLKSAIVPLCNLTFAQAQEKGEVDAWKASRKETEACAEQFSAEFGKAYHERRMPEFLAEMADKYGMERCKIVLASTIQLADHDGRYYPSTKADAAKITIPGTDTEDHTKDMRRYYSVSCHPVMVNSAFRELQRMERGQSQEQRKVLSETEHDMAAPKSSVLSRLQEKQKQVTQNKISPAKAEDKKRGVEL